MIGSKEEIDMALSDFIGAIGFGMMATAGVVFLPELINITLLGSFVLSFFIKWVFDKIWDFVITFRTFGFYFICFMGGIFIVIGFKIMNLSSFNLWLLINGLLWVLLAFILIKNLGDRVLWVQ